MQLTIAAFAWLLLCTLSCGAEQIARGKTPPAAAVPDAEHKVVVTLSMGYVPVFLNWMIFYIQAGGTVDHLHILCWGEEVAGHLTPFGLRCGSVLEKVAKKDPYENLWISRVNLTRHLLAQEVNVILSDSDAIWLRNPMTILRRHASSSVVAGRGTFPTELSARTGATACFGFVYFRAGPPARALVTELLGRMIGSPAPDDQLIFNRLIFESGLQFPRPLTHKNGKSADTGTLWLRGQQATVTLLSTATIPRHCPPQLGAEVVVAHCMHSRHGSSKEIAARRAGLWKLRGDWAKVNCSFPAASIVLDANVTAIAKGPASP